MAPVVCLSPTPWTVVAAGAATDARAMTGAVTPPAAATGDTGAVPVAVDDFEPDDADGPDDEPGDVAAVEEAPPGKRLAGLVAAGPDAGLPGTTGTEALAADAAGGDAAAEADALGADMRVVAGFASTLGGSAFGGSTRTGSIVALGAADGLAAGGTCVGEDGPATGCG